MRRTLTGILLAGILAVGCDTAETGQDDPVPVPGVYHATKFTGPDETDGQRDVMQYEVDLELTLTPDRTIEDGRYVAPCWPGRECPAVDERTTAFVGSYTVDEDTLILRFDQRIDDLPQEAAWRFHAGKIEYRSPGWPPRPEVTLVRQ